MLIHIWMCEYHVDIDTVVFQIGWCLICLHVLGYILSVVPNTIESLRAKRRGGRGEGAGGDSGISRRRLDQYDRLGEGEGRNVP